MTPKAARFAIPIGWLTFLFAAMLASCDRPDAPDCLRSAGEDTVVASFYFESPEVLVIGDGIEVELVTGGDEGVAKLTWEGPENLVAWAQTEWTQGELRIGDGNGCKWVRDLGLRLKLRIESQSIREVEHGGTGDFEWNLGEQPGRWRFDGRRFAGDAVVYAQVDSLELQMHAGPGRITAVGSAARLGIYAAGLGTVDASEMAATRAFVNQSSAHELSVSASDYAYFGLHGTGDIRVIEVPVEFDVVKTESGELIWPE
jgi:hypothetical protein